MCDQSTARFHPAEGVVLPPVRGYEGVRARLPRLFELRCPSLVTLLYGLVAPLDGRRATAATRVERRGAREDTKQRLDLAHEEELQTLAAVVANVVAAVATRCITRRAAAATARAAIARVGRRFTIAPGAAWPWRAVDPVVFQVERRWLRPLHIRAQDVLQKIIVLLHRQVMVRTAFSSR